MEDKIKQLEYEHRDDIEYKSIRYQTQKNFEANLKQKNTQKNQYALELAKKHKDQRD